MGQTPGIPSTLSDEGKNFLARCFVHDPLKRDTAEDLINHHFTKIYEDDDVASMPLFASVSDMSEMRKSLVRKDSGKYWWRTDSVNDSIIRDKYLSYDLILYKESFNPEKINNYRYPWNYINL